MCANRGLLYHYCSERAAQDLIAEAPPYFLVGTGAVNGFGLYATDIEPVDAATIDEVSTQCFDGAATPAEVNHVLVLHRSNALHRFEQAANPYEWVIGSDSPGALIDLDTLIKEVRRWDGERWRSVASWDGFEWAEHDSHDKRS